MLTSLNPVQSLHSAGLVHRDVKPLNIIFSEEQRRFKLIDLGACADLRTGTNYVPDESILDPVYAPPEQASFPALTLLKVRLLQANPCDAQDYATSSVLFAMATKSTSHSMLSTSRKRQVFMQLQRFEALGLGCCYISCYCCYATVESTF